MKRTFAGVLPAALSLLLSLPGCDSRPTTPSASGGVTNTTPGSSGSPTNETGPWFSERASPAGLQFRHRSGSDPQGRLYLPEIVCGGAALLDYDNDGRLDIYLVQGGRIGLAPGDQPPNALYRNLGNGKFEDVTAAAGASGEGYGMGCAAGDYDGDGDMDLYVTNVGPNILLENRGDGTFTLLPNANGAAGSGLTSSAAFFDYDADGDLDLVAVDYVGWSKESEISCEGGRDYCQPNNYEAPTIDHLYRNDGGTYVDVTHEAGIDRAKGYGLGVVTGDFDEDGRMDFFVANDGTHNHLWIQVDGGRFEERGMMTGTAVNQSGRVEAGMGVAAIDVDDDGDLDLFLSHLRQESNTLYINEGTHYVDATDRYGLGGSSLAFTGFGLGFFDFDLDRDRDLFIANGKVALRDKDRRSSRGYSEENLLYEMRDGRFEVVRPLGGTDPTIIETSRGAAFGDLDDDGDIDIVVVNRDAPPSLLINRWADDGSRHWIEFDVREADGRLALHARVQVDQSGRVQSREVDPHSSYCSSNDPRVHFGLGEQTEDSTVEVRWTDGTIERFGPFPMDRLHPLRRGDGRRP
ncbi:MAG: CRTAC1 family protein [Planctomycetes bacterium]|nr:CRTAC1 family protein [Planctomycetota bacterium]